MPMLARALTALLLAFSLSLSTPALAAKKKPKPWRPVAAEILMDARTGAVLRASNADTITYPASLTKMMTLLMTFEALDGGRLKLHQPLPVSRYATGMAPSRLGVPAGGTITVEQAILALVTKSANDVAVVLAEALGGSEKAFAAAMTARARSLGMKSTTFRNASGLPNREQRTTARDMAVLSRALIVRHAGYYDYFSRRTFEWNGKTITGHNRLLARYEGYDGIKTGFINASGFNLAGSAKRDGRRLIAVVLGGETAAKRDQRVADLLDIGFNSHTPLKAPEPVVAEAEAEEEETAEGDASLAVRASAPAVKAAAAKPVAAVKPPAPKAASAKGGWSVQVGAFKDRQAALRSAQRSQDRLGKLAAGATPEAVRAGSIYKARLTGFGSDAARSACTALKAKRQDCFTLQSQ
ncbi:D-alanyl-D-alanine carboxypeptidase [Azospirillum sp. SYSU D00513]|uniref:D-alanyl-D-alanine carboxypeptidase n=1 Tax=Azospirillum sp. SYSU D00513 TaxID=2812561 RepID=UPI001A956758|nr:D-alanyl-D-alanine carboxypeptidase [Azospirillum sp. SYSU D00513]